VDDNGVEFTTPALNSGNQDVYGKNSWAMSYVYQAGNTGKIKIHITLKGDKGSLHLYGLTNHAVPAPR
jgi:hypothetical protein